MDENLIFILEGWGNGDRPSSEELQKLLIEELATPERAKAFDVTNENGLEKITARSHLFQDVYAEVRQQCHDFGLTRSHLILKTLWQLWLPLAMQIAEAKSQLDRPLIQGILGGQGTGKTTLAEISCLILRYFGYKGASVSIDDLYKTYAERQKLQQEDNRLIWRGPPGTHDVELGLELLDCLIGDRKQEPIAIPRFDKSAYGGAGDRTEPKIVDKIDILLFEGWFVGARPVAENVFDRPPPPIITPDDRQFAIDTNNRLKDYIPLWERLDRLIVLFPVDYRLSKQWRKEAEEKMKATGREGMSEAEIDRFVEYFWRALHPELFIIPLTKSADLVDQVVEIDAEHCPDRVYKPESH